MPSTKEQLDELIAYAETVIEQGIAIKNSALYMKRELEREKNGS